MEPHDVGFPLVASDAVAHLQLPDIVDFLGHGQQITQLPYLVGGEGIVPLDGERSEDD